MPEPDRRTFYELLATVEAGTPDEALAARVTITSAAVPAGAVAEAIKALGTVLGVLTDRPLDAPPAWEAAACAAVRDVRNAIEHATPLALPRPH